MVLGVPISRPRTFRLSASVMWLADLGKVSRDVPESMRAPPAVFLIHHDPTKKCAVEMEKRQTCLKKKRLKNHLYIQNHIMYIHILSICCTIPT